MPALGPEGQEQFLALLLGNSVFITLYYYRLFLSFFLFL